MSKRANPTIIGAFVLGAIIIAVFGISLLSSGQFFSEKSEFVVYFDESVNGLSVGSLVKMQGVPIGKVTDIQVQLHPENNRILTPVFIEIDHEKCWQLLRHKKKNTQQALMEQLIEDGLRLQLQYTSLVTGKLYIESLLRPDSPVSLMHLNQDFAELPAISSNSQKVQNNISDAIREIQNIPFQELFAELLVTVKNVKQLTGSDDMQQVIHLLATTLVEVNGIMRVVNRHSEGIAAHAESTLKHSSAAMAKLDKGVAPLLADAHVTLASSRQMLAQLQQSAGDIGAAFNPETPLQQNLNSTLLELRRAAKSLRLLADYLERYPEALIKGKSE